jgi:hypothetical protein
VFVCADQKKIWHFNTRTMNRHNNIVIATNCCNNLGTAYSFIKINVTYKQNIILILIFVKINSEWYFAGSWYCSEVCRTSQNTDHKQAYAMSTLWRGLLHYVERDVERENDGLAMITLWRLNMLEFWEYGHYKYLTLAYRLLASELIWNYFFSEDFKWNQNIFKNMKELN